MTDNSPENRREHVRKPVSFTVMVAAGDERSECETIDMSVSGAKIMGSIDTEQGARLVLDFADVGRIECEVMWRGDGVTGVRFSPEIEEAYYLISALMATSPTNPTTE